MIVANIFLFFATLLAFFSIIVSPSFLALSPTMPYTSAFQKHKKTKTIHNIDHLECTRSCTYHSLIVKYIIKDKKFLYIHPHHHLLYRHCHLFSFCFFKGWEREKQAL